MKSADVATSLATKRLPYGVGSPSGVVPSVDGLDVCYNFFDGAFIPVLTRRESKSRFLFFFCSFRFNKFKVRFHLATIDL